MIIVTGTSGFIGSNLIGELIESGYKDLVCCDLKGNTYNSKYLEDKNGLRFIEADDLCEFIEKNNQFVETLIHLGACSDTTETRKEIFQKLNLDFSKSLWKVCTKFGIPLIYASSAATYGSGEEGFSDYSHPSDLSPLNLYGWSKNEFDNFALESDEAPFFWSGLKFFNVFGPNEDHKNGMASVVLQAYRQIKKNGKVKLFKSHKADIEDGDQKRDFIYVKDACRAIIFMMEKRPESGIYNIGTGIARSFRDLVTSVFSAMKLSPEIEYIDTPSQIREHYQYYTCASTEKLRSTGYHHRTHSLEAGVEDYVCNYLIPGMYH